MKTSYYQLEKYKGYTIQYETQKKDYVLVSVVLSEKGMTVSKYNTVAHSKKEAKKKAHAYVDGKKKGKRKYARFID